MSYLPNTRESQLDIEGNIACLSFQRDDVRNALSGTFLIDDLIEVIRWLNKGTEISALVLTGSGSAFSSGGNIKEMQKGTGIFGGNSLEILEKYRHGIQELPRAVESCEVPIIAAVNGHALGVGFDLACMCDLRIGSSQAKLGEVFVNLGLIPGDGGSYYLPRVVGEQRAMELTLTGRIIDAEEALKLGVFLEIVSAEDLLPHAKELAKTIAKKPQRSTRLAKRLLKMSRHAHLNHMLDMASAYNSMLHKTEEHQEALEALINR